MTPRNALISALLFFLSAQAAAQTPLILGIFPRQKPTELSQKFKPLIAYLSATLNRPVEFATAKDFPAFWEAVTLKKYDIVHYNQYHYIKSHKAQSYEAVAMNEEEGYSTLMGALIVRDDSAIKTVADLKGRKIMFGGDNKAMIAYVVPIFLLKQAGLARSDFTEEHARNPMSAIVAVARDYAAAAGASTVILNRPDLADETLSVKMRVLAKSEPFAHLPWAVKSTLDRALIQKIRDALLNVSRAANGPAILESAGLTGLRPVTDADYNPHRVVIKEVMGEEY